MTYRKLRDEELNVLVQNNCIADDWANVQVVENFNPENVRQTRFSGDVRLGSFHRDFTLDGGLHCKSGVVRAVLHNVTVGDDVYIGNISDYIANYNIGDGTYVNNVDRIVCDGESCFGNGVDVSVLNETGGRDVPIYDRMSAPLAYMLAMYRYRPDMVSSVNKMIKEYAGSKKRQRGEIGKNAKVCNTGSLRNVIVGDYATIEGASRLENGTIAGSEQDPVFVGSNVMAQDFILCSGARVCDGAVLTHTFVGQGSQITHLFSAHDSLFFANCVCENGEAAAIFGGPYTVSMHKSSLLIAGMFSFLNAGSGSNQSNHMYKLGPIHQGVVDRGSKTTSDSYVLWPAKIGAFSLVMGRHVSHPDTSRLPFSYLIENKGKSYLVPGVNLKSVGTIRDARKWPKRDCRKDEDLLDPINFNLLSPYTIGKMLSGIELLGKLEETSGLTADRYSYQSMIIEPRALRKGKNYYRLAIEKFMGNSVISRLKNAVIPDDETLRSLLAPTNEHGTGDWIDMSGLLMPKDDISDFIAKIESGDIKDLSAIEAFFDKEHSSYYDMEWTWVVAHFEDWYGKRIDAVTREDIIDIVGRWKDSVVTLDKMLYEDANKEFSMKAKTGFGVDGSAERKDSDFEQVRGDFDSDPFVKMVLAHIKDKSTLGFEMIKKLSV